MNGFFSNLFFKPVVLTVDYQVQKYSTCTCFKPIYKVSVLILMFYRLMLVVSNFQEYDSTQYYQFFLYFCIVYRARECGSVVYALCR